MKLTRTLAATVTGLALSAAVAAPASAIDDPTPTVATVTLIAGSLSIDAPATAAGSASVAPGTVMTVNIGTTTLTDTRGSLLGWTATGSSTDFVKDVTYKMPKALFTWTTGAIATVDGSLTGVSVGAAGTMAAGFPVAVAAPLGGAGTFTYPATITGAVPVNLTAGAYVATITQSVV